MAADTPGFQDAARGEGRRWARINGHSITVMPDGYREGRWGYLIFGAGGACLDKAFGFDGRGVAEVAAEAAALDLPPESPAEPDAPSRSDGEAGASTPTRRTPAASPPNPPPAIMDGAAGREYARGKADGYALAISHMRNALAILDANAGGQDAEIHV